ncbi:hypothetical protein E2C01_084974 [Portunus trituberculatus]|uniref:Uncharacterized protein n=1 Tax=Portunus trituberculatus TaxID=210409 RepID=A0A5B7JAQ1_PORTR|nr:hypothetical protein [Portunus trituberculatus]
MTTCPVRLLSPSKDKRYLWCSSGPPSLLRGGGVSGEQVVFFASEPAAAARVRHLSKLTFAFQTSTYLRYQKYTGSKSTTQLNMNKMDT